MTRKELYNICHDEAVAYANSEQWSKRTGEQKSFLIQGYLDAMMEMRKSEITEKKKEYPKTYEECCEIMNVIMETEIVADAYLERLDDYELNLDTKIENLRKLLICRDAYWKIAGEEMGLGKPWEPDWEDEHQEKYIIGSWLGTIQGLEENFVSHPFAFPTPEMRNAFKENFDPDIEICKGFL